jgi:DNA repair ATPase RecN
MTMPSEAGSVNSPEIKAWLKQIEEITNCDELQKLYDQLKKYVEDQLAAVNDEVGVIESLLVNPTNLDSAINWIKTFINLMSGGYTTMIAQLVAYAQTLETIIQKITEKSSSLGCNNFKL